MDDSSLPSYPPTHLLIAPLGVDCKFAVVTIKKKLWQEYIAMCVKVIMGVVNCRLDCKQFVL